MFVHRKLVDGDVYFVDNRQDRAENLDATFRVEGKAPELWDPATGATQPISYRIADGRTTVPLHLDPYGTHLRGFSLTFNEKHSRSAAANETVIDGLNEALNGDWSVSFEPGRGVPEIVGFHHLVSWSDLPLQLRTTAQVFLWHGHLLEDDRRSGDDIAKGAHLWLDLGDVRELADVKVNDVDLGIFWKTPFKVDVTSAIKPGRNRIEIQVTNLWVNRMIGDQQPWAMKKYAFADFMPYKADSPLLPSGLLGPVRLISATCRRRCIYRLLWGNAIGIKQRGPESRAQ